MTISFDDATAFRTVANYIVENSSMFTEEEMKEFISLVDAFPANMMKEFQVAKKFAEFLIEVRNGE